MIERMDGMPAGTVGLRASGKLSKDDYTEVLEPALREGVEWVAKAMHMFTWLTPGEVLVRDLDGLGEAKAWVAG